ncbi:DNA/RNA non-specific endonuclease [Chitinimonas sp.]|uniref:DNA/RNA non-specific endonuclease n=1 Tax=Chitinimonas sp. TaxID=1934313 RepID=UPI002F954885
MRIWLISLLLLLGGAATAADCSSMLQAIGEPVIKGDRDELTGLLCREGYVLVHDNALRTPVWVVEHLTPARFAGTADRKKLGEPFAADSELPEGKRAEKPDYVNSGYDRGHMAPAADMKWSDNAMVQSFLLSNMAPQQGQDLNRHIWADLEEMVRNWTCERGDLYAITGPIYDQPGKTIGADKVAVPSAFFKMVVDLGRRRVISFILPNARVPKQGKPPAEVLQPYIVTVREVEERSGMHLLSALAPREQRRLATLRSVMWPVRQPCAS